MFVLTGGIFLLLFFTLDKCYGIDVTCLDDGMIVTELSVVKFEGIDYIKRSVNTSTPATISFNVTDVSKPPELSLSWTFAGSKLSVHRIQSASPPTKQLLPYSTESFSESTSTLTVVLHLTHKSLNPGNYSLIVADKSGAHASATGFVKSAPVLPLFSKPKRVLEGDVMRLVCQVASYPKPEHVVWSFAHIPTNKMEDDDGLAAFLDQLLPLPLNASHYVFETTPDGVPNDTLRFTNLLKIDNGLYACNVSTALGSDFAIILVNVKDRWAAMWPFVGIVIEVSVLVIAILLYERHQMRSKPSLTTKADVPDEGHDTNSAAKTKTATMNSTNLNHPDMSAGENINGTSPSANQMAADAEPTDSKPDELRQRVKV